MWWNATQAMCLWRAAVAMSLSVSLLACSGNSNPPDDEHIGDATELPSEVILQTDSDEWRIAIIAESLYYDEAVSKPIPNPFRLPTKDEAKVLRTLDYPHRERFVTSDGYTFGMPSASVSKAGSKTKYSVLGLWRRPTRIYIEW
jgi:hypothetical protein